MYMVWWKQKLTNFTQEWICFLNNIILGHHSWWWYGCSYLNWNQQVLQLPVSTTSIHNVHAVVKTGARHITWAPICSLPSIARATQLLVLWTQLHTTYSIYTHLMTRHRVVYKTPLMATTIISQKSVTWDATILNVVVLILDHTTTSKLWRSHTSQPSHLMSNYHSWTLNQMMMRSAYFCFNLRQSHGAYNITT